MVGQISDSELELMRIIWENGGVALYSGISQALADRGKNWQKNTIITLLSRLVEKGVLKTHKIGHKNQYIALVSESSYRIEQTKKMMDKFYEGSAKGLVSTLIQKELLSASELEELKDYWKDKKSND